MLYSRMNLKGEVGKKTKFELHIPTYIYEFYFITFFFTSSIIEFL
jgi:hypothetical protein